MNSSEALTFKNVTVSSSDGHLSHPTAAEAVVVQPGVGVVVFIHGEPRFVLRQDEGLDVFPARTDGKEMSVVSGTSVVKLQFLSDGNAKSFRQAVEQKNKQGDLRGALRSSLAAEASMSKATTAMAAASRDDDYARRDLINELNARRDKHRSLAQKFNSGSDTESYLIRERFSSAAERSRQRMDQLESRHIERLEAALLASGKSPNNNNAAAGGDRQNLWNAWAEAEAHRDQDSHRVGIQNKRDNQNIVQWQQNQRRREQIFNELQGELRHFDAVQVSSSPSSQQQQNAQMFSPQSMRLIDQVRGLLYEHQSAVHDARVGGAALAEQQIVEERHHQQEVDRLESERRQREEQDRLADMERRRQAEEEARNRFQQEQEEREKQRRMAQAPIRMHGDWKELMNPDTKEHYFLNVVTQKVTTDIRETPFYVPPKPVPQQDPVLAKQDMQSVTKQQQHSEKVQQPQQTTTNNVVATSSSSSSSPQASEVNGDWKAMKDANSGKIYFYNTATKKTTWKIEETSFGGGGGAKKQSTTSSPASTSSSPQAGEVKGDWKAMKDANSGKIYFYNSATKKTTWKIEETAFAPSASSPTTTTTAAATSGSSSSSPQAGEVNGDWKAMKDANSGKIYFYNSSTKKTTWKIEETSFAKSSSVAAAVSSPTTTTASGSPKEGEIRGDWKAMLDKNSGKTYFYNTSTKKTTWKIEETSFAGSSSSVSSPTTVSTKPAASSSSSSAPQAGEVNGDWKAMQDKNSGKIYFYNSSTKKTTWKIEETSFGKSSSSGGGGGSSSSPQAGEVKGDWKAMKDANSGKIYFYNSSTKRTTWKQSETSFA